MWKNLWSLAIYLKSKFFFGGIVSTHFPQRFLQFVRFYLFICALCVIVNMNLIFMSGGFAREVKMYGFLGSPVCLSLTMLLSFVGQLRLLTPRSLT